MYVCMYVCLYICMYVCMYLCIYFAYLYIHVYVRLRVHVCTCIRAGKKVRIFEPSFVCYAFEDKFLPRCHAHFIMFALVQSKRVVNKVGVFHKN